MRQVKIKSIIDETESVPGGKHWVVRGVVDSEILVSTGAKLTIARVLMGSKITIESGAEVEIKGMATDSKIIGR